jgi:hypothetical protein
VFSYSLARTFSRHFSRDDVSVGFRVQNDPAARNTLNSAAFVVWIA